ncbi:MAG: GTP cyclohydrolase I, partial [Firmicutes bacterium]|nr:GTP cyclohydrolase I [Bacillota bacterium]
MIDQEKIARATEMILEAIGEDLTREGLRATPRRVAKMYAEVFAGMEQNPREHLKTCFYEKHDEMILVKDIPFYSMCEHHLLPFYGRAHVAYIPDQGRVVGLSKLARVTDIVARRPQLQERL